MWRLMAAAFMLSCCITVHSMHNTGQYTRCTMHVEKLTYCMPGKLNNRIIIGKILITKNSKYDR